MGLINKLEAIATAIRNKTNTSNKLTLDEMPAMIESISGGGMIKEKPYINFYGFGGTLLHSYSLEDFNKLSSLPRVPDNIAGFKAIGWNKDIDSIKTSGHHEDVGAIYERLPNEVVVEELEEVNIENTKLYFHFDYPLTMTVYFRQSKENAVNLDWGDGTVDTSPSSYGVNNIVMSHNYAAGDYALTFIVEDGATLSLGTANSGVNVIGTASNSASMTPKLAALYKAEICTKDTVLLTGVFRNICGLKGVLFSDHKSCTIPTYAFENCYSLTHVRLGALTSLIYDSAFRYCYVLNKLTLPPSLTSIAQYVFMECRSLSRIVIPPSVKTISNQAFQGCIALKEVVLNEGLETLGSYVFNNCYHLEKVSLPTTLKTINTYLFNCCYALKKIAWPKSVSAINAYCFVNCYSLKEVIIPEGVTTIGTNAFNGCQGLKYIAFPLSMRSVQNNAFNNCYNMRFYSMNQGLESIGSSAFFNNYGLKRIILPESVKTISERPFQGVRALEVYEPGEKFKDVAGIVTCSNFKDSTFSLFEKELFEKSLSYRTAAFEYSTAFRQLEIPEGVTEIASYAFRYNYALEKLKLPLNLVKINSYAFSYNSCLESIEFPKTLTNIYNNAFEYNQALESISFPASLRQIDSNAFSTNYSLKEVEFSSNGLILNGSVFNYCYGLDTIKFKVGVTNLTLGTAAFGYTAIENLDQLPSNIKLVGSNEFQYCYCLKEADLSGFEYSSNNYLNGMFYYCHSLKKVIIPDSFDAIGSSMFYACYSLEEIEIPRNVTLLNSSAFYECRSLKSVVFKGNTLETIASSAFNGCFNLNNLHLPYTLKSIQTCFSNCYGLHDLYFYSLVPPTGVNSLGSLAEGYVIHVPKGTLSLYEKQFTGHKGHFEEFVYIIAKTQSIKRKIGINTNSIVLKDILVHSELDESAVISITTQYEGTNLTLITPTLTDEGVITVDFTKSEQVSYNITEDIKINVVEEISGSSTEFILSLFFMDRDYYCEFEVNNPAGYAFEYSGEDEYYYSSNTGVHGSYALAKVTFVTSTGKLYVDCTGQGEANYDYGIVSKLDTVLGSSNAVDNSNIVQRNFYGLGTYEETVEFNVDDEEEHFIYIKYRKDGSGNVGKDYMKFRIRFE